MNKIFDEKQILNLRDVNDNRNDGNNKDDGETILIDPNKI